MSLACINQTQGGKKFLTTMAGLPAKVWTNFFFATLELCLLMPAFYGKSYLATVNIPKVKHDF